MIRRNRRFNNTRSRTFNESRGESFDRRHQRSRFGRSGRSRLFERDDYYHHFDDAATWKEVTSFARDWLFSATKGDIITNGLRNRVLDPRDKNDMADLYMEYQMVFGDDYADGHGRVLDDMWDDLLVKKYRYTKFKSYQLA